MKLHRRIHGVGHNHRRAMAAYKPAHEGVYRPVQAAAGGGQASPPSVTVMPQAQVLVYPAPGDYSTLAYQGLYPIFTADGAAIPATAPGMFGQLRAAGGGRHG